MAAHATPGGPCGCAGGATVRGVAAAIGGRDGAADARGVEADDARGVEAVDDGGFGAAEAPPRGLLQQVLTSSGLTTSTGF